MQGTLYFYLQFWIKKVIPLTEYQLLSIGTRQTGSFPPRALISQGQTSKALDIQAKIVTSSATALTLSEWGEKQTNTLAAHALFIFYQKQTNIKTD